MKCKCYFCTNIQHINEFTYNIYIRMYEYVRVCVCVCRMYVDVDICFVVIRVVIYIYSTLLSLPAAVIRCAFVQLWFLVCAVLITGGDSDTDSDSDRGGLAGISNFALLHQLVAFGDRRRQKKNLLPLSPAYRHMRTHIHISNTYIHQNPYIHMYIRYF